MSKVYISIEEAAALEGVDYEAFKKRVQREHWEYDTRRETSENGGKDRVVVELGSLSKKARRTHKEKQAATQGEPPWYTQVSEASYREHNGQAFYQAVEKARLVEVYLEDGAKGAVAESMADKTGVSTRTFANWVKAYLEATAWAEVLRGADGADYGYFKVLALCRKPREHHRFPSLVEPVKTRIENLLYEKRFLENREPLTNLYEDLADWTTGQGLPLPSYDTVWRYCSLVKTADGEGPRLLQGEGTRTYKNQHMMKRQRDTGSLQVREVYLGDVHAFDCWVAVRRSNGKMQAIRPALVAWMDMRSRALMGWAITEKPDARAIKKSLLNAFYPKANQALPHGLCRYLLIDNGKEYTAECLTGRPRKVRVSLDADAKGFYRSIGIEDDMRSLPYQPWSKSQLERAFGTICEKFSKRMDSYTGTLTGSLTSGKVKKNVKKMLEQGNLMGLEDFAAHFETWVVEKYHVKEHGGLEHQGEPVPTPMGVYQQAEQYFKPLPPLEYAVGLLQESVERKVTPMGIRLTVGGKPLYYQHQALMRFQGRRVGVRYYPEDITKVFVYDDTGRQICVASTYDLLPIGPAGKVSQAGLEEHLRDQQRQLQSDRERIRWRRMTYEERLAHEAQLLENAGKKITMPELAENAAEQVTALPTDAQYREDKKAKRQPPAGDQEDGSNDYFRRQAEKFLAQQRQKLG